ncbi:WapI family immunity protein [Quadrisphaera oryzae]|uniref:WapI family immunity protein n=1 Tax=Quadrisphaera TaxID=317661 RepID=UPI001644D1A8|nr:hypothetical protein [Quadrisphaera sp. RL12-1S]MBC3762427.1 hypothetical protein [Quadrisphaera sp. RL12-1S]
MRLGEPGGDVLDLQVVGYEFALRELGTELDEWDVNWLVIAGRVQLADGRTWRFRDPALLAGEAAELLSWLQDDVRLSPPMVADVVGTSGSDWPREADATGRHWLSFIEPTLAFATVRDEGEARLLVGLALECAEPAVDEAADEPGWSVISVPWSYETAQRAAVEWARQVQAYPPRA